MTALTTRQTEVLAFITHHIHTRRYPPTVRDIARHFGIGSPNGVLCHLKALEKKGAIRRNPNVSRGIWIPEPDGRLPFGGEVG